MNGKNPTSDAIERALAFHAEQGLIRSWKRLPGYGAHGKWEVEVHPNVHSADGLGTYVIRTYAEGNMFCAALASARAGIYQRLPMSLDDLEALVITAGEIRNIAPVGDYVDLTARQVEVLDLAEGVFNSRLPEED